MCAVRIQRWHLRTTRQVGKGVGSNPASPHGISQKHAKAAATAKARAQAKAKAKVNTRRASRLSGTLSPARACEVACVRFPCASTPPPTSKCMPAKHSRGPRAQRLVADYSAHLRIVLRAAAFILSRRSFAMNEPHASHSGHTNEHLETQ